MLGWRAGGMAHLPVLLVWKKLFNYVKEVTQWAAWVHKTEETKKERKKGRKKKKTRGKERKREEKEREQTNKWTMGLLTRRTWWGDPEPRAWGFVGDEDNEQEEEECLGWDTYRSKEAGSTKHLGGRSWFFLRGWVQLSHLAGGHSTMLNWFSLLGVIWPLRNETSVNVMLSTGKSPLSAAVPFFWCGHQLMPCFAALLSSLAALGIMLFLLAFCFVLSICLLTFQTLSLKCLSALREKICETWEMTDMTTSICMCDLWLVLASL